MKAEFEEKYPDAALMLNDIKLQEDLVANIIGDAKIAVCDLKETVGPFLCKRKWSAAGYDSEKFTQACADLDSPEILIELIKMGAIKSIVPDNGTKGAPGRAVTYLARNPDKAGYFIKAWKEESEMTPAITVPKL